MSLMVSSFANFMLKLRMFFKVLFRLIGIIFILQIILIIIIDIWMNPSWEQTKIIMANHFAGTGKLVSNGYLNEASDILLDGLYKFWILQKIIILKSSLIWVCLPMILLYLHLFGSSKINNNEYIRGAKFVSPKELNKELYRDNSKKWWSFVNWKRITFGEVYLPVSEENKQTFIVGKPGSGKTNAFNHIIEIIRKRKQKLIIHDYKGDYVEKFYREGKDIIFNPLDKRSIGWCLFNDCESVIDIEGFATALIPDASVSGDPFWNNAARDILIGILRYCYDANKKTNKDIWETCILPNETLYKILQQTKGGKRGAKHLEDSHGKTAVSIMSNFIQYVKIFEYMSSMSGDFSITEWVESKNETCTIFVTNYAKLQHTLNPVISLFVQTLGNVLLSQTDNIYNRVFFCLDEFGQLQNMSTIQNLMTASRSKGGSIFIGVQDIGQIDKIYKKETRTTILNSASNRMIFNCKDHDTAKFFSVDIGETEYYEAIESQSLAMNKHDRINTSRQRRKDALISTEDIQSLPNLSAFISIGHHSVTLTQFKYKKLASNSQAFIQRPELELENIIASQNYIAHIFEEEDIPIQNKGSQREETEEVIGLYN